MNNEQNDIKTGPIKIDPSKFEYKGHLIAKETDNNLFVFKDPLPDNYCPIFIVSHEGDSDFTIFFGNFMPHSEEFKAEILIILSYGEIIKFRDVISKNLSENTIKVNKSSKQDSVQKMDSSIKKLGMTIYSDTKFFSPNWYLVLSSSKVAKIYFGRKMGIKDGKQLTLFTQSIIIPLEQIISLVSVINTNIGNFEKEHNVNIEDLTLKRKRKSNQKIKDK